MSETKENIYECRTELRNKQHMADKMTLKSPVTGYILSSDAGYAGETVSGGQKLFVIVPGDSEYIFQGYLSDRYIADVEVGDTAQIKLQAYSYSDYGAVSGRIIYISPSPVSTENGENMYSVNIKPDMESCNENIDLIYGLSGNMEINTGKRSVIDYFLEPVLGNVNNSLKEK